MGLERTCRARINGRALEGLAHLEPGELRFAATTPIRIPLTPATTAITVDGRLELTWPGGEASLELGRDAEAWALKIRYPRSRLDKLGVTETSLVSVIGIDDEAFDAELAARSTRISSGRVRRGSELAIVGARSLADLDRLTAYREAIAETGAIWVVWAKGQKALTETHVRAAAKAQGLVDVKVMSFSERLSALKLMIPRAQRTARRTPAAAAGRRPRR